MGVHSLGVGVGVALGAEFSRLLSTSSVNVAVSAVRFLYAVTLGRETVDLMASVRTMKRPDSRASALLMTIYACGLRISEATELKTSDIDRARMELRVRNGKGAKGRVLPLSERLLKELENYWRAQRQGKTGHDIPWLFLGKKPVNRWVDMSGRTSITAR
jgi:integrase/recombinase XerD